MLELGMNPLCVTSTTCDESELGRKNILNLQRLGVDHIQFTPNPIVRKKMNKIGLKVVGDISWPEHVGIFTIPVRVATQYGINLIVWGENSQHEYGGPATAAENSFLDRRWLEEFGGLLGLRVSDLVGMEGITHKDIIPYSYPTNDELKAAQVTGMFLGYYFPWDGLSNTLISTAHGFKSHENVIEGSIVNYENVDNYQTGIHDYFKFLKFGFGRATDLACLHIRRGRITREQGLKMVQLHDGKFPCTYLGKPLEEILNNIDMSVDDFVQICDSFTNKKIFKTDFKGNLVKDNKGNLIKLFHDNV
jgi:N-acetyl sugar amidotransferase